MTGSESREHPADIGDALAPGVRDEDRHPRPATGDEKALLSAFLDFQRDTLLWKVTGLTEEQLRKAWTPSGLSLLGLVKHLAYVEHNWFQGRFMGRALMTRPVDDPDCDFRIEPAETADSIIALFSEKVAESKRIVQQAESVEVIAASPDRPHSLRRILVHMIEETARHNGHADLMREYTDGHTGE